MTCNIETTCPYCGVGCGVKINTIEQEGEHLSLSGCSSHPANKGQLCSKGSALGETVQRSDRLHQPMVNGQAVNWNKALDIIANKFTQLIEKHGPNSVAMYVSGQLLTEDYYVANKWMKGYIGTANIDTNSRLCMASAVVGYKRAFGKDTVPCCYEDLELADLIVMVGSNAAWTHPVLYQRIVKAKKKRPEMKVVVIDPRKTATCDIADLHLPLKPGSDAVIFNGLLAFLAQTNALNQDYIQKHTEGFNEALKCAQTLTGDIANVASLTGLDQEDLLQFFQWYAQTPKTVSFYSQGVNQSSSGVDKSNAIINAHLATGRIGNPGMGPFSITGQPNAMGGREVGGLSNQLAAHMDFEEEHIECVRDFWQAPTMANEPGLKAVDLFRAIEHGDVKAVWIMSTNPVVSLPDTQQVKRALEKCELVVVSDIMAKGDTSRYADVLLPSLGWGEKDGTVTNSERCISRQRGFLPAPGDSKADWWQICEVAQRMGYSGFDYSNPSEIFREHAQLSGYRNHGSRDFDISAFSEISKEDYDRFKPIQWPVNSTYPMGKKRMFEDGVFYTPSGKAQLIAITPKAPQTTVTDAYPYIFNTGRIRDQWHTMTRTAKSPRLMNHISEPYIEIHPKDAEKSHLKEGQLARVSSNLGHMIARVITSEAQQIGSIFAPMHWTQQYASQANMGALIQPVTDPLSGQPESKHSTVNIEPFDATWYGFLITHEDVVLNDVEYWAKITGNQFNRYELAGLNKPKQWLNWIKETVGLSDDGYGEWVEFEDIAEQRYRAALLINGQLSLCFMVDKTMNLPARGWLSKQFNTDLSTIDRMALMTGRSADQKDEGKIICSCFSVGINTIIDAIQSQNIMTPEQVGRALKAGTNCGSCVAEIKEIILQTNPKAG